MIELIIIILVMAGIVLSLLSSLGFLRLPDVYTRMHAGAKGITLGTLLILVGAFIYFWYFHNMISIRLILGIVFVFLTAPVSTQLVIRAAYRSGVPLAPISAKDDLGRDLKELREAEEVEVEEVVDEVDEVDEVEVVDEVGEDGKAEVAHKANEPEQ